MIGIGVACAVVAVVSTAGNAAERGERRAHVIVMVVLVILALLAFGLAWPLAPTRVIGILLTLMAFSMFSTHFGYERLCCAAHMSFGVTVLAGLPFPTIWATPLRNG